MSILGTIASLYMAILIIILIISFGLIGLKFVNYILTIDYINIDPKNNIKKLEFNKIEVNRWAKVAFYSLLGLIVSFLILFILNSTTSFTVLM